MDGVPSIVGVQVSLNEGMLFNKKTLNAICSTGNNYVSTNK
jgi:hypothetical protein